MRLQIKHNLTKDLHFEHVGEFFQAVLQNGLKRNSKIKESNIKKKEKKKEEEEKVMQINYTRSRNYTLCDLPLKCCNKCQVHILFLYSLHIIFVRSSISLRYFCIISHVCVIPRDQTNQLDSKSNDEMQSHWTLSQVR